MKRMIMLCLLVPIVTIGCAGASSGTPTVSVYRGTWLSPTGQGEVIVAADGSFTLTARDLGTIGGADVVKGSVSSVGAVTGTVTNAAKPGWSAPASGTFILEDQGILSANVSGAGAKISEYFAE